MAGFNVQDRGREKGKQIVKTEYEFTGMFMIINKTLI